MICTDTKRVESTKAASQAQHELLNSLWLNNRPGHRFHVIKVSCQASSYMQFHDMSRIHFAALSTILQCELQHV